MAADPNIRARLKRDLDDLPVLPTVVTQLLELSSGDPRYAEKVLRLVEAEPTFSARVLASANSAASAPASPITTLPAAVARIGSTSAANLVIAMGMTDVFAPGDRQETDLWRHALRTAIGTRALLGRSNPFGIKADEAYAAALLHDVGRFVIFRHGPPEARIDDEGGWEHPQRLVHLEQTVCGIDHTELGGIACARWGIPDLITEVVKTHHDRPRTRATTQAQHVTGVIRFVDLVMFAWSPEPSHGRSPEPSPGPSPRPSPGTSPRPSPGPRADGGSNPADHVGSGDEARDGHADVDRLPLDIVESELIPRLPYQMRIDAWTLADVIRSVTIETIEVGRAIGIGGTPAPAATG